MRDLKLSKPFQDFKPDLAGYWKRSAFIPIPKKGNAKEYSNYHPIHSSHMLAKSCSKFSRPGFNSMLTVNFQMFKLDLERAEEPEIKLPTSTGS